MIKPPSLETLKPKKLFSQLDGLNGKEDLSAQTKERTKKIYLEMQGCKDKEKVEDYKTQLYKLLSEDASFDKKEEKEDLKNYLDELTGKKDDDKKADGKKDGDKDKNKNKWLKFALLGPVGLLIK